MTAITVRLERSVYDALRRKSYVEHLPMTRIINEALRQDLARYLVPEEAPR